MYSNIENSKVKYEVGDVVTHPKFGEGTVQEIEKQPSSVRLHIAFGDEIKIIDQKWLVKTGYKKVAER
jgi:RNA polymerase-interacting CarD/CdnL/TRCF family regulator